MKFKILEEKENPMLKRKEIVMSLDYEGGSTPSKADLQKVLSEQLNANIENVEISKIMSDVGQDMAGDESSYLFREKEKRRGSSERRKTERVSQGRTQKRRTEGRGET